MNNESRMIESVNSFNSFVGQSNEGTSGCCVRRNIRNVGRG
jgi:hypothetical protein